MTSTVLVLPETNGHIRTNIGKPHVVNEGTTAVATIDVAIVLLVSPHFVNMWMRIAVPTAPPPSAIPYPAATAVWSAVIAC
jgi:hypothetical protein